MRVRSIKENETLLRQRNPRSVWQTCFLELLGECDTQWCGDFTVLRNALSAGDQRRHSMRWGLQTVKHSHCEGIKTPGVPLFGVPYSRHQTGAAIIAPLIKYFKGHDVWDSAMRILGSGWCRDLVWLWVWRAQVRRGPPECPDRPGFLTTAVHSSQGFN